MSAHAPKKTPESGPRHLTDAEWGAVMHSFIDRGSPLPSNADDPAVTELLARWDELPAEGLARLAADPLHGPRLARVREVDEWLAGRLRATGDCPDSEQLYDYGRGPGYAVLAGSKRKVIEAHLAECAACESFIETLGSSPPLPLSLAPVALPADEAMPSGGDPATVPPRAEPPRLVFPVLRSRRMRWVPLAAAAAVVATTALLWNTADTVGAGTGLPGSPLLRGDAGGPLLFPRGRLLASGPADERPLFATAPLFELETIAGASLYRVIVRQHEGGAFESGRELLRLESHLPVLGCEELLAPGQYTWNAWAVVDGLDQELGSRDFQIAPDEELQRSLARLSDRDAVIVLHEAGYLSDARHAARRLPPSEERDAYLLALPGR